MLCFKSPTNDTCRGDSGGPLAIYEYGVDDKPIWRLLGLTSFGIALDCNTKAKVGVYTKISKYGNWINENTRLLSSAPAPIDVDAPTLISATASASVRARSIPISVGGCVV